MKNPKKGSYEKGMVWVKNNPMTVSPEKPEAKENFRTWLSRIVQIISLFYCSIRGLSKVGSYRHFRLGPDGKVLP